MTKLQIKYSVHNFIWNAKYVGKILMFQVALVLMTAGVIFAYQIWTHSHLEFKYTPQVISPIVLPAEGK